LEILITLVLSAKFSLGFNLSAFIEKSLESLQVKEPKEA